jgi:hypothetical protein
MTKFGALVQATEALAFARKMILQLHSDGGAFADGHGGGSPFCSPESRAFVRNVFQMMTMTAAGRLDLIALARVGEDDAQLVLRDLILEIKTRHQQLPLELDAYVMELVHNEGAASWPGARAKNDFSRNLCIAAVVAALHDQFGIKPTGRSARQRNGCSIAGEALDVIDQRLSAEAVKSIFKRYSGAMPTQPGWSSIFE